MNQKYNFKNKKFLENIFMTLNFIVTLCYLLFIFSQMNLRNMFVILILKFISSHE